MKKTLLLFLMGILPIFIIAQSSDRFFEQVDFVIEETKINTVGIDFGQSFVGEQLWYSAFSQDDINNILRGKTEDAFYAIFASPIDLKGHLKEGKETKLLEFSAGYHAGPVSFCTQTNELFVTLSNFENPEIKNVVFQKANIPLRIIVLKKSGSGWVFVEDFPHNSSTYSVGHPAISPSGDTLIFTSDIPGKGFGGTDLYMSIRQNGRWGEMINLGEKINTSGDDMFPFIHDGKELIYASDGQASGKGGLDIYCANILENGFDTPYALNPLNSPEDDFGLVIHPAGEIGYYASGKSGGEGHDDIYKVLLDGDYELELLVRDKNSLSPIPNVKVNFSDNVTLYTNNNGLIKRELNSNTDYTAATDLQGYLNESKSFTTTGKPYGLIRETLNIEKAEVGQKFVIENIFYDFDKWNILPESEVELDKLVKIMNDNPNLTVELHSHTDSRGTHAYNDVLSQKRSESAVNYIISKGISRDRITAKGYGETQLVNECKDGVTCSEEKHRQNRRTEFEIIRMD